MITRVNMTVIAVTVLFIAISFVLPMDSFSGQDDLKSSGFHIKQRPPAVFFHDEHNEKAEVEECNVCHHLYENGKRVEDESSEEMSCSDCHHDQSGFPTRTLTRAYHDLCKGCHFEKEAGPVLCGECHERR